jgi:hypothetical protein
MLNLFNNSRNVRYNGEYALLRPLAADPARGHAPATIGRDEIMASRSDQIRDNVATRQMAASR